jgi:hypothetical protein
VTFFHQEKRLYCLNYTQNFVHKFITYYNRNENESSTICPGSRPLFSTISLE